MMKQKMIALAVAAALAAPLAAQAESSNVIVYGRIHASADFVDNGNSVANTDSSGLMFSSNSSRLGFKGTEDLGAGLKAIWGLEFGVDTVDNNQTYTRTTTTTTTTVTNKVTNPTVDTICTTGTTNTGTAKAPVYTCPTTTTTASTAVTEGKATGSYTSTATGTAVASTAASTSTSGSSSTNMINARNMFVGLSGGFGTALIGRHDTPYKLATGSLDVFADTIADYNSIMGSYAGVNASGVSAASVGAIGFDQRTNNTVAYLTPNFNGFQGAVGYVADVFPNGDNPSSGANGSWATAPGTYLATAPLTGARTGTLTGAQSNDFDAWSLSGTYTNGPIYLAAAYEVHSNATVDAAGQLSDAHAWKVGGTYKWDPLTVGLMYEKIDQDAAGDRGAWYLSAKYGVTGNTDIKFAYAHADDTGFAGVNNGADMYALGVSHYMSKRTEVYALYAAMNNDTAGMYSLGGAGYGNTLTTQVAGDDQHSISFGIIHNF